MSLRFKLAVTGNLTKAMDDYENQFGVAAGLIGGVKKTVFNSIDYATIALTTYAPNP